MCGYEEIAPPSSGQVQTDDGCGLLTATLTRAKCRNVHSRWGTPMGSGSSSKRCTDMKVPGHPDPPAACFITEILVKLQPLDFLLCVETLAELSTILQPFTVLFEEYKSGPSQNVKVATAPVAGLPAVSSASLPLLYLDLQAVRVLMPLSKKYGFHDTFIVQVLNLLCFSSMHVILYLWQVTFQNVIIYSSILSFFFLFVDGLVHSFPSCGKSIMENTNTSRCFSYGRASTDINNTRLRSRRPSV